MAAANRIIDCSSAHKRARRFQRLFLVLGILLLALYFLAMMDGGISSRVSLWAFAAAQESATNQADTPAASSATDGANFSLWSSKRVQAYKASLLTKLDRPIAVLSIQRLGLTAPVLDGTDDLTLNRGLGRIGSTAQIGGDGNIGIAGHRDGFFRVLKDIAQGDAIEIATSQGHDLYVVARIEIVDPRDVSVLQPGDAPEITLITCYPFYYIGDAPRRFIVHASLKQRSPQLRSRATPPSDPDMKKGETK